MAYTTSETFPIVQKLFILCKGIPADALLQPRLAEQVLADGNWSALAAPVNDYLSHEASLAGAAALVQRMAMQGFGLEVSESQAAMIAAPVTAGAATWADLILAAATDSGAAYAATLDNRAEAAQAFTDALAAQGKGDLYSGSTLIGAAQHLLAGVTADTATAQIVGDSLVALVSSLSAAGLGHTAADGYLSGSTAFLDKNGNGHLDSGETTMSADVGGNVSVPADSGSGNLVVYGGTDLMTGSPFLGYMTAPPGATVITPLTTLVQTLVDAGLAANATAASALVASALGLPAGVNVLNYDAIAVLADPHATEAAKATALEVETTGVEVMNLLVQSMAGLKLAFGLDVPGAAKLLLGSVGSAVAAGSPIDLTDSDTLATLIGNAAATQLGHALDASQQAFVDQFALVGAASNGAAEDSQSVYMLSRAAHVAQEGAVNALTAAFAPGGDLAAAVTAYTGTNLDTAIAAASVGELMPGVPIDVSLSNRPEAAPTLTTIATIPGGKSGYWFVISYDKLKSVANEADPNGDPISFRIDGITSGSLQEWNGTAWVDSVPGSTMLSAGESIRWKPEAKVTGSGVPAFTVKAFDGMLNSATDIQVKVRVAAANHVPTGISLSSDAIDENNAPGAVVGTLGAVDIDTKDSWTFFLTAGDGDTDNGAFSIVGNELTINGTADFESQESYSIHLMVTDSHGGTFETTETIYVNNLDEVAPTITSGTSAGPFDENVSAGTLVYTVTSDDSGDISNGVSYSLGGTDGDAFNIDPSGGGVTFVSPPDYEAQSSYSFDVIATDAAGNSSKQTVTLPINDINEPPVITSATGKYELPEGSTKTIYTATGTDPEGATVTFILGGTDMAQFTLDTATGALKFNGKIDYETPKDAGADNVYDITISASDGVKTSDPVAIAVTVTNVDEVAPKITSGKTATAIDENSGANQAVYTVTSDDTKDISAGVTYSLDTKAKDDSALFTIDASTGVVKLTEDPNYENNASYTFTVVADDGVNKATSQSVTLAINNIDEVAPAITSKGTATAIDENSGAGQKVYTAKATDTVDTVKGSVITFSLKGTGDDGKFAINSSTGDVTLKDDPDFETKSSYTFTVIAKDSTGNASELPVTLAINNVDDTAPKFTSGSTATSIFENSGSKQDIYTATSDDSADVISGATTYSLKAGDDSALFSIKNGVVTLKGDPDYETKSSYSFTVVATDKAGNASEQAVTLAIKNVDETAPTVTSGATATTLAENSGANQKVYTATSTDSDYVSGSTTYSLQASGDYKSFTIDASTGDVKLTGNPDYETKPSYTFSVIATDAANNASTAKAVTLAITDVNETPTGINLSAATVTENNSAGVTVGTLSAVDLDAGDSFTYTLVTGTGDTNNDKFKITGNTLTFEDVANYESLTSYSIRVQVKDSVANIFETAKTITVTNVDEVAPVFSSLGTAEVDENIGTNQVVYTAAATDTDFNAPNTASSITYGLSGTDAGSFTINTSTGAVKLTGNPDAETKALYNFTVTAKDAAGNNATPLDVALKIKDVNDAPTISSAAVVSYSSIKFTATDQDAGASLSISSPTGGTLGSVNVNTETTIDTSTAQTSLVQGQLKIQDNMASVVDANLWVSLGTDTANTLTVTGSSPAGMWGYGGNDSITAGTGGAKMFGGAGDDTLTGGSGVDTFYFEATAAGNGSDTIKSFTLGSAGDVFAISKAYVTGELESTKAGSSSPFSGAITTFDSGSNKNVDVSGSVVLYDAGNKNIGDVNNALGIATILNTTKNADIHVAASSHTVVVAGAANSTSVYIWYVDNDSTVTVDDTTEVKLVGTVTLSSGDITGFDAANFLLYSP